MKKQKLSCQDRQDVKGIIKQAVSNTINSVLDTDLSKYNLNDSMKKHIKENIAVCINLVLDINL